MWKHCPVFACCDIYCVNVFTYANFIADNIYNLTPEQLEIYRSTTPEHVKTQIQKLYMHNKRLTFPDSIRTSREWT